MIFKGVENPKCYFCQYSKKTEIEEELFCEKKKKTVSEDYVCRKYKYDIFKRDVKRKKKIDFSRFSEDDFKL